MGLGQTLAAGGLILEVGLEQGLIFGGQRRLLSWTPSFARVKSHRVADRPPLALQVRIPGLVPGPTFGYRDAERHQRAERNHPPSVSHRCSLLLRPTAWPHRPVPVSYRSYVLK